MKEKNCSLFIIFITSISFSKSVKEDGTTLNELEYIATDENLVPFEKTTEGWFNFNKFYWIGKTSSSWNELSNWAATLAGTGTITECPPFDNSSLELYITNNSQNPLLIENELVANLLNIPAEKSVEMNSKVTVQTVQNMGEMIFANEISVQELNNNGSIFVNSGILTIENYVPTSGKINLKEGGTLKITKEEETTIPDLTFVKTDSSTEDFASLLGNLSVENVTYNAADIQISGKIKLPDTTEENSIGKLKIESGELTIETLDANSLNVVAGTFKNTTMNVTSVENAGTIESTTVNVAGDLSNDGTMNVATTNIGGNLNDTGTWTESGIVKFVGTNDQSFTPNGNTTYATINVEKTSGILTREMFYKIRKIIKYPLCQEQQNPLSHTDSASHLYH